MDPQLGMGRFVLRYPELVSLDVHQRLAAVINLGTDGEWAHYRVGQGFVTNRRTGIQPVFLHFPGQQFLSARQAFSEQVLNPRGLLSPGHAVGTTPAKGKTSFFDAAVMTQ